MKQNKPEDDTEVSIQLINADKSLRKGTEGFLAVLDCLEGVSREDDFTRLE